MENTVEPHPNIFGIENLIEITRFLIYTDVLTDYYKCIS